MTRWPTRWLGFMVASILTIVYASDLTMGIQKNFYPISMVEHCLGGMMVALFIRSELEKGMMDMLAYAALIGFAWECWEMIPILAGKWGQMCWYEDTMMDMVCDIFGALIAAHIVKAE